MIKKAIFFLLFISGVVYSQTVNGSVQNEDKQNLIGAIVSVEDSNIGVVTDENGLFSIDLTDIDKSKYIVAYLGGYESYRIKVSDFINLKKPIITLKGKVIDLKEVGISPKKMSEKNDFSEITKADTSGGFELRSRLVHHQTRYRLR